MSCVKCVQCKPCSPCGPKKKIHFYCHCGASPYAQIPNVESAESGNTEECITEFLHRLGLSEGSHGRNSKNDRKRGEAGKSKERRKGSNDIKENNLRKSKIKDDPFLKEKRKSKEEPFPYGRVKEIRPSKGNLVPFDKAAIDEENRKGTFSQKLKKDEEGKQIDEGKESPVFNGQKSKVKDGIDTDRPSKGIPFTYDQIEGNPKESFFPFNKEGIDDENYLFPKGKASKKPRSISTQSSQDDTTSWNSEVKKNDAESCSSEYTESHSSVCCKSQAVPNVCCPKPSGNGLFILQNYEMAGRSLITENINQYQVVNVEESDDEC